MLDITERFEAAITTFVEKIKNDSNILAVILYGSLSNDRVWKKSDMDTYVLVREMKLDTKSICVEEDGLLINVNLQTEFEFKRGLERSLGGGFHTAMFDKARVMFARDESLRTFIESNRNMGADDLALSFFQSATGLLYYMEKIEKWLTIKEDPLYTQFWTLKAVDQYANMHLILNGKPSSREAVLKVMEYAPQDISHLYERPMNGLMTHDELWDVLRYYRKFLEDNLPLLRQPVDQFMTDGDVYTVTALVKHYGMYSHDLCHVFDFLDEMRVVSKVTENIRLTPKSRSAVEEVAYMYIGGSCDEKHN